MTICYDERGEKYELPKYVLSNPSNLQRSKSSSQIQPPEQEVELAATVPSAAETMVR